MKTPDYADLYLDLGLQPDCGIDELRHAYRRHVASLHPDREPARPRTVAALSLSDLNALYDEALRFHQRYGRLPGAPQDRAARTAAAVPAAAGDASGEDAPAVPAAAGRRALWPLLLVALAAAAILAMPDRGRPPSPARAAGARAAPAVEAQAASPRPLAIGMDEATVLAIQGEPMRRSDVEWTYGPSWLRFEKGRLADWYSSPLHPLRTGSATPPPPPQPGLAESP